jgi:hypothetical protein
LSRSADLINNHLLRKKSMDLEKIPVAQRKPLRVTSTLPAVVAAWLINQATIQGRSISNLIAHLIEASMRREIAERQAKGE